MSLIDGATMSLAGQQRNPDAFYLTKHPNATPTLYGLRFMEADTQVWAGRTASGAWTVCSGSQGGATQRLAMD